ncbi:MAG: hypothetical protein ACKOJD_06890, partial [Candidatus Limnocylindrus sp.]
PTPLDDVPQGLKQQILASMIPLGAPFDSVRVDAYLVRDMLWLGEYTIYSNSGLGHVHPDTNRAVGDHWKLPDLNAPDPREAEWRALLEGVPKGTLQA